MASRRRSQSSVRATVATVASASLIGGGLVGLGYGIYRLIRSYQFSNNPYKVIQQTIAQDVENQQILVLEDTIARTHYIAQSLRTEEEKQDVVVQTLANTSIRALAAPVVISVNTFMTVSILCSIDTIVRLKKSRLTAPMHTSILIELNKLAVSMDAFGIVEQEMKEKCTAYARTNHAVVVSPAAFMQFIQSFLTTDLIATILSKLLTVVQATLKELDSVSIFHLPLSILNDILTDDVVDPLIQSYNFKSRIMEMSVAFFESINNEFADLIASKAGFQTAYYTRPLLSLNFTSYLPPVDEDFINCVYLMTKARLD